MTFEKAMTLAQKSLFDVFSHKKSTIVYVSCRGSYLLEGILRTGSTTMDHFGNTLTEQTPWLRALERSFKKKEPKSGDHILVGEKRYRIKNVETIGYEMIDLELALAPPER